MGKEMEIRYELKNKNELEKRLNEKAKLIHTSHQIDTYYDNKLNCRFVKHMRHPLMLKGFIAILLFFCC